MSDYAIRVNKIGKKYQLGALGTNYNTLRDTIVDSFTSTTQVLLGREKRKGPREENKFWALRDITFDVHQGQVLGVIGRNGAGKSTLLKILSRVTEPTEGRAEMHGRVGSLLEVGTGFHPELTGRENIYLNGAILGMRRTEIDHKFDEIVAFSEVEKFIDTPVKRYSSGMYLRLAFAVAAHLEPEILVVDEVLAVGDAEFQRKCMGKMSDVAQQGRTVLFVSHNMSAILRLTEETIVLEKGHLVKRSPTQEAVDYYLSSGLANQGERVWSTDEVPADSKPFTPIALRLKDSQGKVVDTLRSTDAASVEFEYRLSDQVSGLRIGLYFQSTRGEFIFTTFDTDQPAVFEKFSARAAGRYISKCLLPADLFNEGRFSIGVNASSYRIKRYFQDEQALSFSVDATGAPGMQWIENRLGPFRPRLDWKIEADQ